MSIRDNFYDFRAHFQRLLKAIREGQVDLGRTHYAVSLTLATAEAFCMDLKSLSVMEFGVATGKGLLELCRACEFLENETGMRYQLYGFDSCTGLPEQRGYVDHPEIWAPGKFSMDNKDELLSKLPPFAKLVEGEFKHSVPSFLTQASLTDSPIGFIAIDVDYYSSAVSALEILKGPAKTYLPATCMYFDDMNGLLSFNSYCGEALAIKEFNQKSALRKIEANPHSGFPNFHCCHVFDHPIRSGAEKARWPFEIGVGW